MKCEISNKKLVFLEYSNSEIHEVKALLTWGDELGGFETLLYHDGVNLYTFWGIHVLLKDKLHIEIVSSDIPDSYEIYRVKPDILEGITLYDFQVASVSKGLTVRSGVIEQQTGSGKSECILATLRYLLDNKLINKALVVVPSVILAKQLYDRAMNRGFNSSEIGVLHGGSKNFEPPIIVAVVNTLSIGLKNENANIVDLVSKTDFLGFDECHHLRASSFCNIALMAIKSKYILGWSGSPFHEPTEILKNSGDTLIYGVTGGVIYRVSYAYLREIGLLAEPIVQFRAVGGKTMKFKSSWAKIYDGFIWKNQKRNELIIQYTKKFANLGFPVLVMTQRLEHAKLLMSQLSEFKVISVFGGEAGLEHDEVGQINEVKVDYDSFRERFENKDWQIAIVSQVADEGMDLPSVGAVIMAGGGKSRIKIAQRVGRGVRRKKVGDNKVYIFDLWDRGHVYTLAHSRRRLKLYQDMEATISDDEFKFWNTVIDHSKQLRGELDES